MTLDITHEGARTGHKWWECSPAVLTASPDLSPEEAERILVIVDSVWHALSDMDRHRFHLFTCEGDRCAEVLALIARVNERIREALGGTPDEI